MSKVEAVYDAIYKARVEISPLKLRTSNDEVNAVMFEAARHLDEALTALEGLYMKGLTNEED